MTWLLHIARRNERFVVRIGDISSWLIIPLIFVIMYDVISRKFQFIQQWVLHSPLYDYMSPTKLQELEWHLHAVLFLLALGPGYFRNAHVRVDLIREKFDQRRQAWIELCGLLILAAPFVAVITWYAWAFTTKSFIQGEGSNALTGIPHRWVIKSFLFIGFSLLLLAILSTAARLIVFLTGEKEAKEEALKSLNIITQSKNTLSDRSND